MILHTFRNILVKKLFGNDLLHRFAKYFITFPYYAQRVGNFKKICKTIAERNQMKKCVEQYSSNCLAEELVINAVQQTISVMSLPKSLHDIVLKFFSCSEESSLVSVKAIKLNAINYGVNECIILTTVDCDTPVF